MSDTKKKEETLTRFVNRLGTKQAESKKVASAFATPETAATSARQLLVFLSRKVESHEVVCVLPSLDMRKEEDDMSGVALPKVGQHRQTELGTTTETEKAVPQMAASVLSSAADASAKAAQVEQKAAQSLGSMTSWTKSSIIYAPTAIAKNLSDSFSSLVDSRVRAWTLLLLRHSLTTGDSASRSRLLSMLSSIIKIESASTLFKTIPLPESAADQQKEGEIILPLLLEVEMKVAIQSKRDTVTLRAPGTISGHFDYNSQDPGSCLVRADIRLDTGALLDSMVQQARMVVFKAVAKATSATGTLDLDGKDPNSMDLGSAPSTTLSGFSSALNLSSSSSKNSAPQPGHRLQKARKSALKLNSVLQGGSGQGVGAAGLDKTRKSRSVQWDQRTDIILKMKSTATPSPKRQRVADTTARLRSFKSFGRPHGGDFGSGPRNATFGDFGRKPIWGRDGKLANHPAPMQYHDANDDLMPPTTQITKNATFTFQKPSIHLSSHLGLDGMKSRKSASSMNRVPSAIPRTATALEGWLVEKTSGKGI